MAAVVLLLQLGSRSVISAFNKDYDSLRSRIETSYRTVTSTEVEEASAILLSENPPLVTVAVDSGIAEPTLRGFHTQLKAYIRAGGVLVLACGFPIYVRETTHRNLFRAFDLAWTLGDRNHVLVQLNPTFSSSSAGFGPSLHATLDPFYGMIALHLKNVEEASRVYMPVEINPKKDGPRKAPAPWEFDLLEQCPVAFASCGEGNVGYIGDVITEAASENLLMAMI
ncbi:hypothetical protein MMC07_007379, partial [Pseudocyphellaria aurata]|nr:hypothetical protein [Pseudocyphellaria aurata]